MSYSLILASKSSRGWSCRGRFLIFIEILVIRVQVWWWARISVWACSLLCILSRICVCRWIIRWIVSWIVNITCSWCPILRLVSVYILRSALFLFTCFFCNFFSTTHSLLEFILLFISTCLLLDTWRCLNLCGWVRLIWLILL